VTLFSVHRVETWRAMYEDAEKAADWREFGGELLLVGRSVIHGGVKELDLLHVVRQVRDPLYAPQRPDDGYTSGVSAPTNMSAFAGRDVFDWVTSKEWLSSYEIFRECLSEDLARQDGISLEEAREVVKQAFWSYLAVALNRKWQARYGSDKGGPRAWLRRTARAAPVLHQAKRVFRSFLQGDDNQMSLPALLRRSSPYHADFMPIYRAITTQPVSLVGSVASSEQQGRTGVP
jgi:hypothetical protein